MCPFTGNSGRMETIDLRKEHIPMWKEHVLPTADLHLAWYEAGDGPVVVFLHGGPGDDHSYLRALAEPLSRQFRCILYDQRGSGHSQLRELDEETLHITRFFDDLEALRLHLPTRRSCRATPPPRKKSRIGVDAPTPEIA